jgi:MIP family channel proteins
MYNAGQKLAAEFMGTFALLFFGVGAICAANKAGATGPGMLGIAVAHGLGIGLFVAAVGHISGGHFNPAVSAAFWVTKRLSTFDLVLYWIAQLAGASVACYLITCFYLEDVWRRGLSAIALAPEVTPIVGMVIEAVITFLLVFVIFGTAVDKDTAFGSVAPIAIGLTITADMLAAGLLTGGAINPARAFGPALIGHVWTNQVVYWVGPLAGGIAAGVLYNSLLLRTSKS